MPLPRHAPKTEAGGDGGAIISPVASPSDLTQRFIFENLDIRGQVVRLGPVWRAIVSRREYPGELLQLLGEFAALSVLIGSALKHPGRAVLQVMGHGPISMAVADCTRDLALRSMLKAGEKGAWGEGHSLHDLFADGRLALTIENADTARHFQSVVPLEGVTLTECFERYFDRSEQIPTTCGCARTPTPWAPSLQKLPSRRARSRRLGARAAGGREGRSRLPRKGARTRRSRGFSPRLPETTSASSSPSPSGTVARAARKRSSPC